MKKIGLIGGTGPESTLVYYKELNQRINALSSEFPELMIESLNLNKALGFVANEQYAELSEYVLNAIYNLEKSGAEIIALTAGTMHVIYDRIKDKVHVPFISIPETVADYAKVKGYKKVGLLGTIFTMENDYLIKPFTEYGIDIVVPNSKGRALVNERISKELEYGIVKEESVNELINVINNMNDMHGIEAVILGCTELPLALNVENCPVDCLDIMEIHIQKLVKLIIS